LWQLEGEFATMRGVQIFAIMVLIGGNMPRLELFFFGSPRIEREGARVEIGLRKALALLVYIVVTGQTHSRDALAALLWPDTDQSTALGRLRRALYRVNRALGVEFLKATRTTIEQNPQVDFWLDIDRFRRHMTACLADSLRAPGPKAGCLPRLTGAVQLYTDEFLAGFSLPDSPEFDEWQFFQAEGLRHSLSRALQQLANIHRAREEWDEAIAYARHWVALDSLHEPAHRELMALYAWSGQYTSALRQYKECRRILAGELGEPPESETTALYEAIRRKQVPGLTRTSAGDSVLAEAAAGQLRVGPGDRAAGQRQEQPGDRATAQQDWPCDPWTGKSLRVPGAPHNLPALLHPLVGRESELAKLHDLLVEDPHCRLLTVTGQGGIGKTRLALEVAYKALHHFPDGVFFVPLTCLESAQHLAATIAEHMGLRLHDGGAARSQLFGHLHGKRTLLLMDNLEHLLPEVELIARLLRAAPNLKILATSHERLNLTGESVYTLTGMDVPPEGATSDPLAYDSVQLLIRHARLARPHLDLNARDLQGAARICRLVQGMPLALALAAGWLGTLSFREVADEISHSLDFLEGSLHDLPERHRSVRAAFDYTWRRLPAQDQQVFARLSVFRGGFTRHAAHQVAGAGPHTLRSLIDRSLVSTARDARYEIHDLLRHYAAEQLELSGDSRRTYGIHSEYYLVALSRREDDLKSRHQVETLDEIDRDLENIRTAWHWAAQQKNDELLSRAAESLYLFFTLRSRHQEGVEFFQVATRELVPGPGTELARGHGRLSAHLARLRQSDPAAWTQRPSL
jgi:predicted ATPase/DNA-binding SARP family transcriptional activator